ncbi:hypothetical protein BA190_10185 [Labrys sp. WJW]|uniref:hypothetical protein n=1 Tax=Labrys sp. WJW TaxID=1737983 RepID=UPI00082C534D|nr:hypothetical protein [Labrys sp. WJW]OCC05262.1 hypothetical protein BA190_10185 [Labrys sp. WJW]
MADTYEPLRNYPIPDEGNKVSGEFPRSRDAIKMIARDISDLFTAVAGKSPLGHQHAFADVPGLQAALDAKLNAGSTFALDDLTDVDASGAANFMVLASINGRWQPWVVSANNLADWDVRLTASKVAKINASQAWTATQDFTGATTKVKSLTAGANIQGDDQAASTKYLYDFFVWLNANGAIVPQNSPNLTGNPTAPTPPTGDNDTSIATTAFVQGEINGRPKLKTYSANATFSPADTHSIIRLEGGSAYSLPDNNSSPKSIEYAIFNATNSTITITAAAGNYLYTRNGISASGGTYTLAPYEAVLIKAASWDWYILENKRLNIASATDFASGTADKILEASAVWSAAAPKPATWATSLVLDFSKINHWFVMGGNTTLGIPTNVKTGQTGYISIYQGSTGGQTMSFASCWKFANGVVPALSTGNNAWDKLYYQVEDPTPGSVRIHANLVKGIA